MINIAEQVKFRVVKEQMAQMVINGIPQQSSEVESVVMVCPHCNNILTKLDPGVPLIDVYKSFADMEDTNRFLKYCPECGTKLSYDKRVVSTQEPEVINEESNSQ